MWCWLRAESDRGELIHRAFELEQILEPFELARVVDGFKHDPTPAGMGRDLTGYVPFLGSDDTGING